MGKVQQKISNRKTGRKAETPVMINKDGGRGSGATLLFFVSFCHWEEYSGSGSVSFQ